ncbi:TIGR02680 family protein [Actinomadura sp. ATCC 31491]|uniref:TIGR02680 family protein n=1 Tax=Actinomadura luzonensis TaxID=2805427 RepID=A0ABT0G3H4_9ACTN|nr:TIGR02680 family protein [Actinomadura luzonensis]MCK2219044.1 TIGR02680 family protein [Actinomadura luzonensis]
MTVTDLTTARTAPAGRPRWTPTRAGILNVWRYYDEVFEFHRGRLLLRGPNGSGKSKVLELLLPYVLDASLKPSRLSTFGGTERTMHWNLMGDGASGVTRVGYVWLEFQHADGRWFTCGARLQATVHTKNVTAAYFTLTGTRVGVPDGLRLTGDAGQPLTRAQLAEALRGTGTVHDSPEAYRDVVRRTLYPGLNEQRYDCLLTALRQLRTPKLSERLDPGLLSDLLSSALPPLDENEVHGVAEGFERLDRQREELRRLDQDVEEADRLAERQRVYAQRVLRASAAAVRTASDAGSAASAAAGAARASVREAEEDLRAATLRLGQEEAQELALAAQLDGLKESQAYQAGHGLHRLRAEARRAHETAAALRDQAADTARTAAAKEQLALRADTAARTAAALADHARTAAHHTATRAGLPTPPTPHQAPLTPHQAPPTHQAPAAHGAPPTRQAPPAHGAPPTRQASPIHQAPPAHGAARANGAASINGAALPIGAAPATGAKRTDATNPVPVPGTAPADGATLAPATPAPPPPDASTTAAAPTSPAPDALTPARALLRVAVTSRSAQIRDVRAAAHAHERALDRRTTAEQDRDHTRQALDTAHEARERAARLRDERLRDLASALAEWAAGCLHLRLDPDHLAALADAPVQADEAVTEARIAASVRMAAREQQLTTLRATLTKEQAALDAERRNLDGQALVEPRPSRISASRREGRRGMPLWRAVGFRPGVDTAVQAGVEAALESAGLLDLWLYPDGEATAGEHDLFAIATLRPAPGQSLADVLLAEPGAPASTGTVLAAIAFAPTAPAPTPRDSEHQAETARPTAGHPPGSTRASTAADPAEADRHPAAVGADGTWRLGPAAGRWSKPEPSYLGTAARERARRRRTAELDERLSDVAGLVAECDHLLAVLAGDRDTLATELRRRPGRGPYDEAAQALDAAVAKIALLEDRLRACEERLRERERDAVHCRRRLTEQAAAHGLPTTLPALDALEEALRAAETAATVWHERLAAAQAARERAGHAAESAREYENLAVRAVERAEEAAATAVVLAERLTAVESAADTEHLRVLERLHEAETAHRSCRRLIRTIHDDIAALNARLGRLQSELAVAEDAQAAAERAYATACGRFHHLTTGHLPADAGLTLATAPTAARAAADSDNPPKQPLPGPSPRPGAETPAGTVPDTVPDTVSNTVPDTVTMTAAQLSAVPYDAHHLREAEARLQDAFHRSREALAHRTDLELAPDGDVHLLTATVGGLRTGTVALAEALRRERDQRRSGSTAAERDLFDRTLAGSTRRHLAERIRQASALVEDMNQRLERVRTASGLAVRLAWQVDPAQPAGTRAARDLLLRDPATLDEAGREALYAFFRDRVEHARAGDSSASWEDQLMRVLDYTAWHRFVVHLDRGDGQGWQDLTRKLHGALSGGEKAIALHLPLFAAVAAHYQTDPECPRFILLDEVFVGVDRTNRGQVFDLLVDLELDLVLTSDHEWCEYRELDGIAIHQLITGDGDDAVTTARFVWNGHRTTLTD